MVIPDDLSLYLTLMIVLANAAKVEYAAKSFKRLIIPLSTISNNIEINDTFQELARENFPFADGLKKKHILLL